MNTETLSKVTTGENRDVVIGISAAKLLELMHSGLLCGADIRAMDHQTKQLVQQACLHACANKVCRECDFSDVCGTEVSETDCLQCQKNDIPSELPTVHWSDLRH
ncbi:hypothetical protein [Hydrogenovibrio marinus]|uniref:Uncharacterized protein n=1 Tax=Hydrogenovibrio marinus TaxID=28885 RepID=A0A067A1E5_HYDMR|nr:hypothetical protein [Hydrogenovibrio marinus]KDN96441.1 hypothetical protein EI16_09235 [Hydrogenovibrio marinus]BBN60363.1 hypothetical protein HVMH_1957 [Hydrogenovibrio marinus]